MILTEQKGAVGIVQLNRPKKLNALCKQLVSESENKTTACVCARRVDGVCARAQGVEVNDALKAFDQDNSVRAIILTGNEKAFAGVCDARVCMCMRVCIYVMCVCMRTRCQTKATKRLTYRRSNTQLEPTLPKWRNSRLSTSRSADSLSSGSKCAPFASQLLVG